MIRITEGKGFHLTFSNGWTASVQFSEGNYCENRNSRFSRDHKENDRLCGNAGSANAEIAAWDKNDNYYRGEDWDDDVKGYVTPEEVARFLLTISQLPIAR